jgi:hypothetical protein
MKQKQIKKTWSEKEIMVLKQLSEMGANNKDISLVLGRTPNAVCFKKWDLKVKKNSKTNFTGIQKTSPVSKKIEIEETPEKNSAKQLASIARQIARQNGKRITMSMFFVEDLV